MNGNRIANWRNRVLSPYREIKERPIFAVWEEDDGLGRLPRSPIYSSAEYGPPFPGVGPDHCGFLSHLFSRITGKVFSLLRLFFQALCIVAPLSNLFFADN